jgi:pyruvate dehydrogenase (quinone)
VTCLILPNDVQDLPAVPVPPREHGTVHSGIGATAMAAVPQQDALRQAADDPERRRQGRHSLPAPAPCMRDRRTGRGGARLGAGIAKALLGKAAVPDDLPFVTGSIGVLGTRPSSRMMEECDTLLMVGSCFPYAEFLPPEGQARCVQIDVDPRSIGLRYPTELGLVGDSRATLQALLPLLKRHEDAPAWRQSDRGRGRALVARAGSPRACRGDAGEPAARVLGTVAAPARPTRCSPATAVRPPTGMRAT